MKEEDYYDIIGIPRSADKKQIKKAYKRLAMKHHPDRNTDNKEEAEEKFKKIQKAYSILSDDQKRQAYDQFGHAGVNGSSGFGGSSRGFEDMFGDIFGAAFGGGSRRVDPNAPARGADLQYSISIDLESAVSGKTEKIRVIKGETCSDCNGTGAQGDSGYVDCSVCDGKGSTSSQQAFVIIKTTCANCNGHGKVIKTPCKLCNGSGEQDQQKTISIDIPKGIATGNRIRVTGEGSSGLNGGQSGDLYVDITVNDHEIFTRDGDNLNCTVTIDLKTAVLGGRIDIPSIEGAIGFNIPEGTQGGAAFKVTGRGVKSLRSESYGDLFCTILVEIPIKLSTEQKSKFQDFTDTCTSVQSPESKTFIEKMKDFFN